ncbi:unnamed protein product [Durusdinium trenchii]|uniref:Dynein heavy chain coiled coil stalk domain-containing protein n=1 Tax=Durusdinium trenchii TaxID=1381693 RepID=A0ABP0R0N3_9DINO
MALGPWDVTSSTARPGFGGATSSEVKLRRVGTSLTLSHFFNCTRRNSVTGKVVMKEDRYMPGFILVDLFGRRRLIGSPDDLFEDRDEAPETPLTVAVHCLSGSSLGPFTWRDAEQRAAGAKELPRRIVEELKVPELAQQLWLHDIPLPVARHMASGFAERARSAQQGLTKVHIQDLKALSKPPEKVLKVLQVVMHLLSHSPRMRLTPTEQKIANWTACQKMMSDMCNFLEALNDFPQEVQSLPMAAVQKAQEIIDAMAPDYTPEQLKKTSIVAELLCKWSQAAMLLHRAVYAPETLRSLRLNRDLRLIDALDAYADSAKLLRPRGEAAEGTEVILTLVVDQEEVFDKISECSKEGFDALTLLAPCCPERALRQLASSLQGWRQHERQAALECLKAAFSPDQELAGLLAREWNGMTTCCWSDEALAALQHLTRDGRVAIDGDASDAVVRCVAQAVNMKSQSHVAYWEQPVDSDVEHPTRSLRQSFLDFFAQLLSHAPHCARSAIDALWAAVDGAAARGESSRNAVQLEALEALKLACAWEEVYGTQQLLPRLAAPDPVTAALAARAACTVATTHAGTLVEAVGALIQLKKLRSPELQVLAESYGQLAPAAPNPFITPLLRELRVAPGIHKVEILKVLEAVATDEQKIGQLLEALRGLFQEADLCTHRKGLELLDMAVDVLERLGCSGAVASSVEPLLESLIRRCTLKCHWTYSSIDLQALFRRLLWRLVAILGGSRVEDLERIALGFTSGHAKVREESQKLFSEIPKAGEAMKEVKRILLDVLDDDFNSDACCIALQLLESEMPDPDLEDRLVRLLGHPSPLVRAATVEVLRGASAHRLEVLGPICLEDEELLVIGLFEVSTCWNKHRETNDRPTLRSWSLRWNVCFNMFHSCQSLAERCIFAVLMHALDWS